MASKYPVPESTRPGSITVTVTDIGGAGGALSGALVNLYSAPAGTTVTKFNARTWEPDESALLQTGRTDNEGKVIFAGLEPALYLVKYQHHPETQAQCVEVGPGCIRAGAYPSATAGQSETHIPERRLPGHHLSAAQGRRPCVCHGVLRPVRYAEAVRESAAAAWSDPGARRQVQLHDAGSKRRAAGAEDGAAIRAAGYAASRRARPATGELRAPDGLRCRTARADADRRHRQRFD